MAIFKKNDSWYIDYYVNGRRKRESVGPNKKQARTVLQKRKVQIAENKYLDIRRFGEIRLNDMNKEYLEIYSKPNKRSYSRDETIIGHLDRFFAGKYLHEITVVDIERYKRERLKQVSKSTVNRELACLKHIFKKANEWGKTDQNPPGKVRRLKTVSPRIKYLETEEIKALYNAAVSYLKPIILTAVNTGVRKRQLLNLKWTDLDFRNRLIYLSDTKGANERKIPMNQTVYLTLLKVPKNPNSPYVFCHQNGKPYKDLRASLNKAAKEAGIERPRFHDLRHTFASHLVMAGVDLKTVQELLGHKTIEMTLRYSHLSPDHKRAAMEVLGRRMDTIWTPTGRMRKKEKIDSSKTLPVGEYKNAEVAKLVDAQHSGCCGVIPLGVRLPPSAPFLQ